MTLVQLKYVVAVDTYRHFASAADHCFVTQPTLSMQINKLEKELDVLIFDRSKHPVEPTEVGKKIIGQARKVLQEAERVNELVQANRGVLTGEFRLGIIPTVSSSLLPRFLKQVNESHPTIHFKIEELHTSQILEKISKDQLDAGILATPLNDARIIEQPLFYEPFMAYVPEGHRLEKEEFVLSSELHMNDMLLLKNGHCFRNSVINLCNAAFGNSDKENRFLELQSGSFETLLKLSKNGFGMTLIPYLTALDLPADERQYIKPLEHPQPSREISLVYSRAQLKISMINMLAGEIKNNLPKKLLQRDENKLISPLPVA